MMKWIGAAILTLALLLGGRAAIDPAAAAPLPAAQQQPPQAQKAADVGARRHYRRHYHDVYRSYYPTYYDRPYYYAPAPFFPFLGLGYGPWW
jgi:hypothetical protein